MSSSNNPVFGERAEFGADDICYRHRNTPTFTLCSRCGNNICSECQVQTQVGLICPDCSKAALKRYPAAARRSNLRGMPVATYTIMALSGIIFAAQLLSSAVTTALWYAPLYSFPNFFEPWRMLTSIFTHSSNSLFHILFNMFALWIFGRSLELYVGRLNFVVLYLLSGFGGSLAVMLWGYTGEEAFLTPTVGASGAIFGVLGATLVIMKAVNANVKSLMILIGINIAIGFLPGTNISWQAHLGGLVVGLITTYALMHNRVQRSKTLPWLVIAAIATVLVLLSLLYFVAVPPFMLAA